MRNESVPRPPETPGLDPRDRDLWVAGYICGAIAGYRLACQDVKTERLELELNDGN